MNTAVWRTDSTFMWLLKSLLFSKWNLIFNFQLVPLAVIKLTKQPFSVRQMLINVSLWDLILVHWQYISQLEFKSLKSNDLVCFISNICLTIIVSQKQGFVMNSFPWIWNNHTCYIMLNYIHLPHISAHLMFS